MFALVEPDTDGREIRAISAVDLAALAEDGQSNLSCNDGDGRPKIIVGMGAAADLHLQGFDDLNAGIALLNARHQRAVQNREDDAEEIIVGFGESGSH